jgi:uncharacterized OB-fold protein
MGPESREVSPAWYIRTKKIRNLVGTNCSGCGQKHLGKPAVCPDCGTITNTWGKRFNLQPINLFGPDKLAG